MSLLQDTVTSVSLGWSSNCSQVPKLVLKKHSLFIPFRLACRNLFWAYIDRNPIHLPSRTTSR